MRNAKTVEEQNKLYDELLQKIDAIVKKYPMLFPEAQPPRCGFSVGPGWLSIIDKLCQDITFYVATNPGCGQVHVAQIKEKFGGLRFYADFEDEFSDESYNQINELIKAAETESYKTCEDCGAPGRPNNDGWVKTLCEKCDND